MQLFVLTQSNEADRLRRSGLQSLSQPTGLTALAAANPLVPARSKRAAASVAWVFVMASLTVQQGAMAIPVRLQPQVPAPAVMQLVPGKAETPKRHTALLSTHKKSKAVQEAHNQSEASAGLDFFQLAQSITSDIEDNSSDIYPYITPALLENNTAALYHQVTANNTVDAIGHEKQQLAENPSVWPWVRMGSIVRKAITQEAKAFLKNKTGTVKSHRGADGLNYLDKEERQALLKERDELLKSVNGNRTDALSGFFAALQRDTVVDHRLMTLPMGIAALAVTAVVCLWLFLTLHNGNATKGVRSQVEALHVSRGHEIQDLFQMKDRYDCCHFQPLSPGLVLRLQGTVTAGRLGSLVAPLSKRDCVHFSASASTKRHDGIHPLPIAFHSMCVDFTITLLDAPEIQIKVCGHDVVLFDSDKGMTQDQRRFSDSPDHWQDFIMTHRAPGAEAQSSAALRSETSSLEFREVALVTGAVVTCVGELRQGHDGVLRLFPCGEVGAEGPIGDVHQGISGERWRTSWERPEAESMKAPEKVLISDDKRLLKKASRKVWGRLGRHIEKKREEQRKEESLDDGQGDGA